MKARFSGVLWPALFLLLGTLFFRFTDSDIAWMRAYAADEWSAGAQPLWRCAYQFGSVPALLAVAASVIVLLLGLRLARWAAYRRPAIFLILLMALGPGLVVNAVLKDHWGRPRPREVLPLGGTQVFEPVASYDSQSTGKSFPCGHATMGFYFIGGYFIFRRRSRHVAWIFAGVAAASGLWIGWARVVQGGHFPSDVWWAGGILWLLAAALAALLRLDEDPASETAFRPVGWRGIAAAGLLLPALVFSGLLATPIDRKETFTLTKTDPQSPVVARLLLQPGRTEIRSGDQWDAAASVHGFGLPGSGIKSVWKEEAEGGEARIEWKQRASGICTELDQKVRFDYDASRVVRFKIVQAKGTVDLHLPAQGGKGMRQWELETESATLQIFTPSGPLWLTINGEELRREKGATDHIKITHNTAQWKILDKLP